MGDENAPWIDLRMTMGQTMTSISGIIVKTVATVGILEAAGDYRVSTLIVTHLKPLTVHAISEEHKAKGGLTVAETLAVIRNCGEQVYPENMIRDGMLGS